MFYNGGEGEGEGGGGGGLWEGEHLDNVNSILQAALADKPHPKFGNLNFGKKKFRKKLTKINQKWSLEKDVLHVLSTCIVSSSFLNMSTRVSTHKRLKQRTLKLTYNFSSKIDINLFFPWYF